MFVLTVDQQASTRHGDRVPELLARLEPLVESWGGVVLPFERTVGDEVQAVVADPTSVLQLVLTIIRVGNWRIGLGIGHVNEPLPAHSREASGSAFIRARAAVDQARSRSAAVPVTVCGDPARPSDDAEALLRLLGSVVQRRSAQGWEVVDLLWSAAAPDVAAGPATRLASGSGPGATYCGATTVPATQRDAARILGISEQAVSQRLRTALWAEERAAWPLAIRLLAEADQPPT
jgi:hypothetical protein